MHNFRVIPAFPNTIGLTKLEDDLSIWNDIEKIKFNKTTGDDSSGYVSEKMRLLNEYMSIKKIILDAFYKFKNDVLKLEKTDFSITTSWMTMTPPEGFCQFHHHRNSVYSGVLYQKSSHDTESGNLIIKAPVTNTMLVNKPSEFNIYNSDTVTIEPEENLLVFFPSHLQHKISKNTGKENRYSIAMNFFPVGELIHGDSSLALEAG